MHVLPGVGSLAVAPRRVSSLSLVTQAQLADKSSMPVPPDALAGDFLSILTFAHSTGGSPGVQLPNADFTQIGTAANTGNNNRVLWSGRVLSESELGTTLALMTGGSGAGQRVTLWCLFRGNVAMRGFDVFEATAQTVSGTPLSQVKNPASYPVPQMICAAAAQQGSNSLPRTFSPVAKSGENYWGSQNVALSWLFNPKGGSPLGAETLSTTDTGAWNTFMTALLSFY